MTDSVGDIESRVAELVDGFRQIGATQMHDLPIYNPRLEVEAVDFQAIDERWIGVLITPWFMSAILLPTAKTAMDIKGIGKKTQEALPAGTFAFVSGGIETVGSYQSLPLCSPMGAFASQDGARAHARARLLGLLTPPAEVPDSAAPASLSRRDFLRVEGKASRNRL